VDNSRRQKMEYERLVTYLDRMAGVVTALLARDDVEVFGEKINDLAFTFITPLGAYNDYYF
jgi:hypothetical protein